MPVSGLGVLMPGQAPAGHLSDEPLALSDDKYSLGILLNPPGAENSAPPAIFSTLGGAALSGDCHLVV